jgi:hypothetical protein
MGGALRRYFMSQICCEIEPTTAMLPTRPESCASHRGAPAGNGPGQRLQLWIPAFAGMTNCREMPQGNLNRVPDYPKT